MARAKPRPRRAGPGAAAASRRLTIEVVWGDITQAIGDLFVVGHYQGVLPQFAERALDIALSGTDDDSRLVLTDLTRRGVVRGALGDVVFFPWGRQKTVVLAGMGRPGTFQIEQLRRLASGLVFNIGRLIEQPTVCSVLIGSGAGTLTIADAVSGIVNGLNETLAGSPRLTLGRIKIVERSLDRALETLACFKSETRKLPAIRVQPHLSEGLGGTIPDAFGYSMLLAAVAQGSGLVERSQTRQAIEELMAKLPSSEFRDRIKDGLSSAAKRWRDFRTLALQFPLAARSPQKSVDRQIAMRVSFCADGDAVSTSAITNTVTVAERKLGASLATIQRALQRLQAPPTDKAGSYGRGLARRLIHSDFAPFFDQTGPLVVEVDRQLANVQWEMLVGGGSPEPIGVTRAVARQLRTTYSPRPADLSQRQTLRALVIGDPGDPARGENLPDARQEAIAVARQLKGRGVAVTLMLGAPGAAGPLPPGAHPADLLEVVDLLSEGVVDLVHYCGHALWDPSFPGRTGWLFKDGLLTAGDLEALERPPLLVVANACFSAGLSAISAMAPAAGPASPRPGDAGLVAGLADEFFKRGISDYIGTAWAVPSRPATRFARDFYAAILPSPGRRARRTLGEAVRLARHELYQRRAEYGKEHGSVWGAYQHYGDPTRVLELRS